MTARLRLVADQPAAAPDTDVLDLLDDVEAASVSDVPWDTAGVLGLLGQLRRHVAGPAAAQAEVVRPRLHVVR
jgi:hypothetical protein